MSDVLRTVQLWLAAHDPRNDRGASLVEYALLVALIAIVCIVAMSFLGTEASDQYTEVGSSFNNN